MGNPVDFTGANMVFRAPESMTSDECSDLPVLKSNGQIVSCWRLSEAEIARVNQTGVVWLSVYGQSTPPVVVAGTGLFEGTDPIAEPYIPPAKRKTGQ